MIPSLIISAASSSAGKTTVVCAIEKLLSKKFSLLVEKIGPDFIDPLFHSSVSSVKTGNLDLFFNSPVQLKEKVQNDSSDSDFFIIEGAMGYFDGVGGNSVQASAFDVARTLDCPVILVIDAKGKSLSICAEILGFLEYEKQFCEKNHMKGVILNRCSSSLYSILSPKIKENCGIEVLGFLEYNQEFSIESRHLGLVTPDAVENLKEKIEKIAESASKTIDLEKIIEIAKKAKYCHFDRSGEIYDFNSTKNRPLDDTRGDRYKIKIAVARDEAFCFYYRENLELLESYGAELCFFSPLKNEAVPKDCSALYIGGGYPELFWEKLSRSSLTSFSIRQFCRKGAPVFAECGGFLYLQLLGILKGSFENKKKLVRFGYIELEAKEDNFLLKSGEKIRGHEFHYFDTTENGASFTAKKPGGRQWDCINVTSPLEEAEKSCCSQKNQAIEKNIIAGFPHLFFPSNLKIAENFVNAALFYESMNSSDSESGGCSNCSGCHN